MLCLLSHAEQGEVCFMQGIIYHIRTLVRWCGGKVALGRFTRQHQHRCDAVAGAQCDVGVQAVAENAHIPAVNTGNLLYHIHHFAVGLSQKSGALRR